MSVIFVNVYIFTFFLGNARVFFIVYSRIYIKLLFTFLTFLWLKSTSKILLHEAAPGFPVAYACPLHNLFEIHYHRRVATYIYIVLGHCILYTHFTYVDAEVCVIYCFLNTIFPLMMWIQRIRYWANTGTDTPIVINGRYFADNDTYKLKKKNMTKRRNGR